MRALRLVETPGDCRKEVLIARLYALFREIGSVDIVLTGLHNRPWGEVTTAEIEEALASLEASFARMKRCQGPSWVPAAFLTDTNGRLEEGWGDSRAAHARRGRS